MREFEVALQNYLKTSDPEELDKYIINPSLLLEPGILPADNRLVLEAEIIMDCFNSYNQGIDVEDLEEELLSIPKESPLYSWRCTVLAIKEFYNENNKMITEYVNEIRETSPLVYIRQIIFKRDDSPLYNRDSNLVSSVDALTEVINNSLHDMFKSTVELLFSDLRNIGKDNIDNVILTLIEESLETIPWDTIHSSIITYTGLHESLRLMALGTLYTYPEKSLEYWFSYIMNMEFKDINDIKLKALLSIVKDITKALIKEKFKFNTREEKKDFRHNSILFLKFINRLHSIDFENSKNPLTNLKKALNFKIKTEDEITESDRDTNLQMELF